MKVRKNHTRFLCGSLAAAAAISPILSITAWADNISTANFNLRQQVVKLTGIMEISVSGKVLPERTLQKCW